MTAVFRDDVPIVLEREGLEVRGGPLGDGMRVAFVRVVAGATVDLGLGEMAHGPERPRWVYLLRGQLSVAADDGSELYEAGQAAHLPPGASPRAIEECELVAFSPDGVTRALRA